MNPNDILDFDIHDFLSDEEIAEATAEREMSEDDAAFWASFRLSNFHRL